MSWRSIYWVTWPRILLYPLILIGMVFAVVGLVCWLILTMIEFAFISAFKALRK